MVGFLFALIRPSDIGVGGLLFYHGFFLSSFFVRPLISELAEWNSTISGHMVVSKFNLKMHVRNLGHPFLLQIGGLKPPLSTSSQLKGL